MCWGFKVGLWFKTLEGQFNYYLKCFSISFTLISCCNHIMILYEIIDGVSPLDVPLYLHMMDLNNSECEFVSKQCPRLVLSVLFGYEPSSLVCHSDPNLT